MFWLNNSSWGLGFRGDCPLHPDLILDGGMPRKIRTRFVKRE